MIVILFSLVIVPSHTQAHSASTFNVIIKQNDLQPGATQIEYNDSIMWYNADSRDNITHRIVFDADGDGLYNGSADWDSGEISQDCNYGDNNTTSDCQESFLVWFNGTWGVGEYKVLHICVSRRGPTSTSCYRHLCKHVRYTHLCLSARIGEFKV